jgi:hypothetical protein
LSATSQSHVSPEKLFDYTPADDNDDNIINFEGTNDEDVEDPNQEAIADKYDIDQLHELKEDNSFPSYVVHLELATMCCDGNFPLKTYDEIL